MRRGGWGALCRGRQHPDAGVLLLRVAELYKPGLDGAQAQALLPDSRPEMPREQPRLGYCSTSLLPSPAKEKQQEKYLTSPLPALPAAGWGGGDTAGIGDGDKRKGASLPSLAEAELGVKLAGVRRGGVPGCGARWLHGASDVTGMEGTGTVPESSSLSPRHPAAAVPPARPPVCPAAPRPPSPGPG